MTLIDIVNDLLRRADLPGDGSAWVQANEMTAWPQGTLEVLEASGLVLAAPMLDRVSCDECDEPHVERVLVLESATSPARPFIPCPANGRVFLERDRLRQWRCDCHAVAQRLTQLLETGTTPREVIAGRCWSLGVARLSGGARPSFLIRGACWPDAGALFERKLASGSNAILFLLGSEGPPLWRVPGSWIPLVDTLRVEKDQLLFDISAVVADGHAASPYALQRRGKLWDLVYEQRAETIPHRVGFLYLAQLLQYPGRAFPALELVALADGRLPAEVAEADVAGLTAVDGHETADVIDEEAGTQYRRRIAELDAKKSSVGLTAAEEKELQALRDQLAQALGVGGRPRKMAGPAERARSNVWHALERAYQAIEQPLPLMAQYLRNSIDRGSVFTYRPHEPISWNIDLGSPS